MLACYIEMPAQAYCVSTCIAQASLTLLEGISAPDKSVLCICASLRCRKVLPVDMLGFCVFATSV